MRYRYLSTNGTEGLKGIPIPITFILKRLARENSQDRTADGRVRCANWCRHNRYATHSTQQRRRRNSGFPRWRDDGWRVAHRR